VDTLQISGLPSKAHAITEEHYLTLDKAHHHKTLDKAHRLVFLLQCTLGNEV